MISPSFANVSKDGKFCLGDLSVTGYTKSKFIEGEWQYGCFEGAFQLKLLGNDGIPTATYYWLDYKFGESEEEPEDIREPGWYIKDGKNYNLVDATTLATPLDQGTGFWTIGSEYKLVSAGQVTAKDLLIATNLKLHTAIGNSTPCALTLGDLSVTGYTKSKFIEGEWQYGCFEGAFQLKFLGNDGTPEANYYWLDYKFGESEEEPEDVRDPGWYVKDGKNYNKLTPAQLDEIPVPAGQGFWTIGSSYKLVVPAPEGLTPAPTAD